MKAFNGFFGSLATLGLLWSLGGVQESPQLLVSPLGYQIVQVQQVPGMARAFDVTARAGVLNFGDPASNVTARLSSSSPYFITLDGDVSFGDVRRRSPFRPVPVATTVRSSVRPCRSMAAAPATSMAIRSLTHGA